MRTLAPGTLAQLQARTGLVARILISIGARNRTTGAAETMHLWTGGDTVTLTVEGEERTWYGAGSVIELPALTRSAGLDVRMHNLRLANLTPEVVQLLRAWDPRFGAVVMHRIFLDPLTRAPVDPVIDARHRVFRGFVDQARIERDAAGLSSCTLVLATSARVLTRTLPLKKSDESQRLRDGADRFRRYAEISGAVEVWWGEKRVKPEGKR